MAKYIDIDKAQLEFYKAHEGDEFTPNIITLQTFLLYYPPADVRPVVRGRWILHMNEMFPADSTIECDQCHEEQSAFISDSFCPNCGADMREVGTEAIKRNTTKIVEKANGIYAEYIRHLQEENKALDEKLASLRNEADAGIEGR